MNNQTAYQQAIQLLKRVATPHGFLASAEAVSNYNRIWARDGVICGLAALVDGDEELIEAMRQTLMTLATHQHELGHVPSNVHYTIDGAEVSYGGLTGRVDTVAWFIIGVCQYTYHTGDRDFLKQYKSHILQGFRLQHSWEFNNGDLMYVPRSGNWADEYPTQGFILYDQLLRVWALRSYLHFEKDEALQKKHDTIVNRIEVNFKKRTNADNVYHPKAYKGLSETPYWIAALEPAGYQTRFDAFANALVLILHIGEGNDNIELINYTEELRTNQALQLLPAFWPVITPEDEDWQWLINNCKYEFRNHPYEFHNGGVWNMVNGFYGLGLIAQKKNDKAETVLQHINLLNEKENWGFYENFNSKTTMPNGVSHCAWSAAGTVLLEQALNKKSLLI